MPDLQQLIPILVAGNFNAAQFKNAGIHWRSENEVRWAYRTRRETGLTAAFKRQGKRILVDAAAYHAAMAKNVA